MSQLSQSPSLVLVFSVLAAGVRLVCSLPILPCIYSKTTPVRLSSGALAVFSPIAITPEIHAKLREKGNNLKYIIAPSMEHHIFIGDWARAFPQAQVIGPEGLAEKRAASSKDVKSTSYGEQIPFSTVFSSKSKYQTKISNEFDADFEYEYIADHPSKELVFFYKPDRTLIVADYMFNSPPTEQYSRTGEKAEGNILSRLFQYLQSTEGRAMGQRRIQWYAASSKNRKGFNESVAKIDSWDFRYIIPCHGDVIEDEAKGIFRKVFEWHLAGKGN